MSKVWIVTGAARGLGRSIAEAVLAAGDRLVAGARDPARLADLAERYGDRLRTVQHDVTDEAAAAHAAAVARDAFGRIDVLVNNAGYGHTAPFEQMSAERFRDQIDTNLFGVINLTRAVLPTMRAQRSGHIFQVSSVGGRTATPGLSAYQAAKWAVGGFSDVLAKEVAPFGVRVCTLEPGGMRTEWAAQAKREVDALLPDYQPSVGKMLDMLGSYGGREVGDPARIAALIVELSRRDDVPLRLLLGADALFVCEQAETQRAQEAARWRDTTLSTMFPDAKLPEGLHTLKQVG
ncbi:TPA: SDR family NAD(P)-dependent oxidoreductase [Burkholderia vietnamiensis]|uniref:SDR family NAD(P)-dependent oxidoreductase n=1 Tax=Burkholderia TaxID=32008 RepID=UPI001592AC16|nr:MULTISPECIES: SDR family NAD(P)-dependent oxidoreductase [Burkholderia]MBR7908361.1 SDR family NAD(P)-dependent oxidoreductase [Burkholderia vietnamiensis]MBR8191049.1 SDR family NAD(P)-dependent oxidoreductase [Burkholderia vietnamiensis]QMI48194.1 SDR family NAD(P)-dependent oxidoreductase [Burkholderia sp. MBR-1]HDR9034707.1 SDR family NAD(P)-dependent oxidoreductase [Burkholderia vietnamiensis]HDR9082270.1 SDR family NAD(P)-dependent oxidoreductase [Burkholderia vietnamiensis]